MKTFKIDGRAIGDGQPTFVIAEIGVNHDGSAARAVELVNAAAACGADAVKLQIFRASSLMHQSAAFASYQSERTCAADPAEMLRQYELAGAELDTVIDAIRSAGLVPIATPFSIDDVDTIHDLALPAVKIASPDLVNRPLLQRVAKLRQPMLVSTGAATMEEVKTTVGWLREWKAKLALLHCISSYPAPAHEANLSWIEQLKKQCKTVVGYSDHATEIVAGACAAAHGATIIEKHLTYDCNAAGPDHSASLDPQQFAQYVNLIRQAEKLRGGGEKRVLEIEQDVRHVSRQSVVLMRDVAAGRTIEREDLTVQRPGTGISAARIETVIGKRAARSIARGTMLEWEMLSDAA